MEIFFRKNFGEVKMGKGKTSEPYVEPIYAFGKAPMTRVEFNTSASELLDGIKETPVRLEVMRQMSKISLFFFCVYVLGWTYLDNDFAFALCYSVQQKKYGRIWILAREHFKSTIITIGSTIREICLDPESTRIIYSYKYDSAKDLFFAPIKRALESNPLLKAMYPDVLWGKEEKPELWTATSLNVKRKRDSKECTLMCCSLTAQATGSHYDYMIYDDCVTPESVATAESIDSTIHDWQMSVNTGNSSNLNLCVIGTFYHFQELYNWIIQEGVLDLVLQPCIDKNGTPVHLSQKVLEQKKKTMGSSVYASQMLCDPKQSSASGFDMKWIQRWQCKTWNGLNVYIFVDPSGKVARKRDYCVMWVLAVDDRENFYVVDLIRDKFDLKGRTDTLMWLVRTYNPISVFYEQVGMQADIEHIREEQARINFRFPIVPVGQSIEKNLRIEALQPLFEAGRIYFPERCIHRNWEGKDEDMLDSFIRDEYRIYPYGMHDDGLDSLSFMCHKSVLLRRPDKESMEQQLYESLSLKIGEEYMLPYGESEEEYKPY